MLKSSLVRFVKKLINNKPVNFIFSMYIYESRFIARVEKRVEKII